MDFVTKFKNLLKKNKDSNLYKTKEDIESLKNVNNNEIKDTNKETKSKNKKQKTTIQTKEIKSQQIEFESNNNIKPVEFVKERILSIDRFRGLCMFMMALSIFMPMFSNSLFTGEFGTFLGSLFQHAPSSGTDSGGAFIILPGNTTPWPDVFRGLAGVSLADIFAPMFIFAIGLTILQSFRSREKKVGTVKAYLQLAIRFLALIGLGSVLNGFEDGWADIFFSKAETKPTFESFSIQIRIYAASFWIFLILLIPNFISLFLKTNKFNVRTICANCNKWFLAIIGLFSVYFIMVKTGELFPKQTTVEPLYGSWVWDTLQNIGLAGLYSLPFITLNKWVKLGFVSLTIAIMSVLYQNGLFSIAGIILEGGAIGGIMWACILLYGVIFYELREHKSYWAIASINLFTSVALVVGLGLFAAKRGATPMYALFSASIASIVFGIFELFNNWKPKWDVLADWGGSAIFLYLFLKLLGMIMEGAWSTQIEALTIGASIPIIIVIMSGLTAINFGLRYKNIHIRI